MSGVLAPSPSGRGLGEGLAVGETSLRDTARDEFAMRIHLSQDFSKLHGHELGPHPRPFSQGEKGAKQFRSLLRISERRVIELNCHDKYQRCSAVKLQSIGSGESAWR